LIISLHRTASYFLFTQELLAVFFPHRMKPTPHAFSRPDSETAPRTTLVLGASTNPARYSNIALNMLLEAREPTYAIGARKGEVAGIPIHTEWQADQMPAIDTVTLYLNPQRQSPYQEQILALRPRRVIFNPGTENPTFAAELKQQGITPVFACTLVMLRTGQY
jgi:predicted CoA-binding protein